MKLCTFSLPGGSPEIGILNGDEVADLNAASVALGLGPVPAGTLGALAASGANAVSSALAAGARAFDESVTGAWRHRVDQVALHYPYRPRKNVVIAGGNARTANGKVNDDAPAYLRYHTKSPAAAADPGATVQWSAGLTQQVYAVPQLAVVVGERLLFATPEQAQAAVLGYATAIDLRAWDLMQLHGQWVKPISLDGFFPWGPAIVTADEVADPDSLEVELALNDEVVLSGSTADTLLSVGEMLAEYSTGIVVEPGDVFLLGTPDVAGFDSGALRWLADGDVLTARIARVGEVSTVISVVA